MATCKLLNMRWYRFWSWQVKVNLERWGWLERVVVVHLPKLLPFLHALLVSGAFWKLWHVWVIDLHEILSRSYPRLVETAVTERPLGLTEVTKVNSLLEFIFAVAYPSVDDARIERIFISVAKVCCLGAAIRAWSSHFVTSLSVCPFDACNGQAIFAKESVHCRKYDNCCD